MHRYIGSLEETGEYLFNYPNEVRLILYIKSFTISFNSAYYLDVSPMLKSCDQSDG